MTVNDEYNLTTKCGSMVNIIQVPLRGNFMLLNLHLGYFVHY